MPFLGLQGLTREPEPPPSPPPPKKKKTGTRAYSGSCKAVWGVWGLGRTNGRLTPKGESNPKPHTLSPKHLKMSFVEGLGVYGVRVAEPLKVKSLNPKP